jgi:hypothetical protein
MLLGFSFKESVSRRSNLLTTPFAPRALLFAFLGDFCFFLQFIVLAGAIQSSLFTITLIAFLCATIIPITITVPLSILFDLAAKGEKIALGTQIVSAFRMIDHPKDFPLFVISNLSTQMISIVLSLYVYFSHPRGSIEALSLLAITHATFPAIAGILTLSAFMSRIITSPLLDDDVRISYFVSNFSFTVRCTIWIIFPVWLIHSHGAAGVSASWPLWQLLAVPVLIWVLSFAIPFFIGARRHRRQTMAHLEWRRRWLKDMLDCAWLMQTPQPGGLHISTVFASAASKIEQVKGRIMEVIGKRRILLFYYPPIVLDVVKNTEFSMMTLEQKLETRPFQRILRALEGNAPPTIDEYFTLAMDESRPSCNSDSLTAQEPNHIERAEQAFSVNTVESVPALSGSKRDIHQIKSESYLRLLGYYPKIRDYISQLSELFEMTQIYHMASRTTTDITGYLSHKLIEVDQEINRFSNSKNIIGAAIVTILSLFATSTLKVYQSQILEIFRIAF